MRRNLLIYVVENIELKFLHEFLRRNEWALQEFVRHYEQERTGRKRSFAKMS